MIIRVPINNFQPLKASMKKALTILLAAFISLSGWAETIKDIRILNQDGESYDISSVNAFTSFEVGEQVPDRETILSSIAVDVNRMRKSERYSYVNARMDVESDGVVLVYTVVSKKRLRRIEINGGKKSGRKIRKKSELEIGQFADDSTFEIAAAKIKEAYRDYWYPDVKVDWKSKVNDELGTVDVTFAIDAGPKVKIKKIVFEGENNIKDQNWYQKIGSALVPSFLKKEDENEMPAKVLRGQMQQKQKKWHSIVTGAGKYKEEVVDADVFALKSFYMNNGYLDVEIGDPVIDDSKPKKSRLSLRIDEGKRYRIGAVTLTGVESFPEDQVRRGVRLRRGQIASYENIEAGREVIRAFYGNRGYVTTSVRSVYGADAEAGVVDIEYALIEGVIGYINDVNITGNERTLDKVIRRELVIYPGEKYNRSRVKTSENRLRNLNYFDFVTVSPDQTEESDKYDLDITVKEKATGQFTAGIGFSSVDDLVGYVELSQGNFNWKTWPPIGGGQKFKIRATLGTQRNDLDIQFVEPWFLNRPLSLGVDIFHHEARYFSDSYDQQNDGFRISLGKPLSRFTRGRLSYTLEQFDVFDVSPFASQAIRDEEGTRLKSGLDYTWSFDTRDRFFNPTRGNKTSLTPFFAGGPLGGETDICGLRARTTHHWPLIGNMILNAKAQAESLEAYGDSKDNAGTYGEGVPIFDRLFLGGSYNLRGFEFRDVGPTDPATGDTVGGNSSALASVELTYPLWNKIRGALFYDWGFVNVDSWDFDTSMYHDDWGIGLRLDLPGFPLQLDYAWPMNYDERYLSDKGRFNFLIGHTF